MEQTAESVSALLIEIEREGAHMLLPSTHISYLPPGYHVSISKVYLDPDPENQQVYVQEKAYLEKKARYSPHKVGLQRLSNAVSINWAGSKRIDDGKDPDVIVFHAVGAIMRLDGSILQVSQDYDIDFKVQESKLRERYARKAVKYNKAREPGGEQGYIDSSVTAEMIDLRATGARRAESGGKNRVLRCIFGLANSYTRKALDKPFVVVNLYRVPTIAEGELAMGRVYGLPRGEPQRQLEQPMERLTAPKCEVPEDLFPDPLEEPPDDYREEWEGLPDGRNEEEAPLLPLSAAEFLALEKGDRLTAIGNLAKQRGIYKEEELWKYYLDQTGKERPKVSKMKPKDLNELFKVLT